MARSEHIPTLLATHEVLRSTPEVWLDVSLGRVSPEDAATQMEGVEAPELIERSVALFSPPSAQAEQALRERILDSAVSPRRSRWWIPGVVALAAAVVLTFLVAVPRTPEVAPLGVEYRIERSAGFERIRGGSDRDGPSEVYRIDQRVDFVLRPSDAVDATALDVAVLAYDAKGQGMQVGEVRRLSTKTGTLRLSESLEAMGLGPGTWELVFVIARPGRLPDDPLAAVAEDGGSETSPTMVRTTLEVVGIEP